MEKVAFEFTWGAIAKIGILIISLLAIYQLKEVVLLTIFAVIISLLFEPPIGYFQRKKIPRAVAVSLVYFFFFAIFAFLIYLFAPLLIVEISNFSQSFSQYFEKLSPLLRGLGIEGFDSLEGFINILEKTLSRVAQNIFSALFSLFGGFLTTIFVIFFAFFLSLEQRAVESVLCFFFPSESKETILDLWRRCQKRVSGWFLSRALGCLFVGILTYISLLILQSEYAFSFGLISAILNFVPILGSFAAGILIFLFLALTSPLKAIFAVIIFTLIQQIENNIITPILNKKFVGLSPSLVLLSLAVGGALGGGWGAILGVPLLGIAVEFAKEFIKEKKEEESIN